MMNHLIFDIDIAPKELQKQTKSSFKEVDEKKLISTRKPQ
jgi:hypothetical protein